MIRLFVLAILWAMPLDSMIENKCILRSKKFDCSYLISYGDNHHTFITKLFDNKEECQEPIELLEMMSFVDIVDDEQFESLLCYSRDDPYAMYHVSLIGKGINRISIERLLATQSDHRYMAVLEENKRMYVHQMIAEGDTVFLAVSPDEHQFGGDGSFILALFLSLMPGKPMQLLPLFILPITKKDIYCTNEINSIQAIRSMVFEKRTQTLWCGLEVNTHNSPSNALSALLCIPVCSQNIQDDSGQAFIAKSLSVSHVEGMESSDVPTPCTVSAEALQCMMTSTALPYLILQKRDEQSSICALPLARAGIASKQKNPKNIFFVEGLKRFLYRVFDTAADSLSDIHTETDGVTQVGGAVRVDGQRKVVKIFGDAVVMLVEKQIGDMMISELHRSVALFEPSGTIKGWTPWQCMYHQSTPIVHFELDRLTGELLIIEKDTVKKIGWNAVDTGHPLLAASRELVKNGQCIRDATMQTLVYNETRVPFFGLVTDTTILLAPLESMCQKDLYSDDHFVHVQLIRCDEVGQLRHICLSYDEQTKQNYIFVAGLHGVMRLMVDGNGSIETQKISDCCDIKKIIVDNGIIYALSEQELYRTNAPTDGAFIIWEKLIHDTQKKEMGRLRDYIISDASALIVSTKGLWIVQPGFSIRQGTPQFEQFFLPQQVGIPTCFSLISPTEKSTDFARFSGGNIFVLCTDFSLQRSQLYRISITPSKEPYVTTQTVQLFDDVVFEKKVAPFLNFGSLQETCFTDGYRFLLLSSNQQVSLSTQPRAGIVMSGNKLIKIPNADFQNSRILYTGINQCTGELLIVTEQSVHIYS